MEITNPQDMMQAARVIRGFGAKAVLVTGGHLPGDEITDILVCQYGEESFSNPRIQSKNTHGTGCTLASAIAAQIAQGLGIVAAVPKALEYVRAAIEAAPGLGAGCGPLDHNFLPTKLRRDFLDFMDASGVLRGECRNRCGGIATKSTDCFDIGFHASATARI